MSGGGTDTRLSLALDLAQKGWSVFPAHAKDRPAISGWQVRATTDLDTIREWWRRWPEALVCVVPGLAGKTCIDIDIHPGRPSGYDSAILDGAPVEAQVQGTERHRRPGGVLERP